MTYLEFETKLQMLRTSDAPHDIKERAIAELYAKYNTNASTTKAMEQFVASQPDMNDIGDN